MQTVQKSNHQPAANSVNDNHYHMKSLTGIHESEQPVQQKERLAYSIKEAADMLGVDYFSVYRLIQRGKLKACRALRGKFLIARWELLRLLEEE